MEEKKKKTVTPEEAKEMAKAAAKKRAAAKAAAEKGEEKAPAKKAAPKKTERSAPEETPEEQPEETPEEKPEKAAKPKKTEQGESVKGLRIGAIVLWVLAIAAEVGAFFALRYFIANKAALTDPEGLLLIGALVVDAICCIVAALLWKKSNRIRPCLADSKLVRTLWHQLGVIMVLVCFLPIGIYLLTKSKDLDKKTRTILLALFALLFVGATATSVDYKQPSEAEVQQLQEEAAAGATGDIYWTRFGKSYHFDRDCQSLSRTSEDNLMSGTIDDAFAANRWDPCDYCAGGADIEVTPNN